MMSQLPAKSSGQFEHKEMLKKMVNEITFYMYPLLTSAEASSQATTRTWQSILRQKRMSCVQIPARACAGNVWSGTIFFWGYTGQFWSERQSIAISLPGHRYRPESDCPNTHDSLRTSLCCRHSCCCQSWQFVATKIFLRRSWTRLRWSRLGGGKSSPRTRASCFSAVCTQWMKLGVLQARVF